MKMTDTIKAGLAGLKREARVHLLAARHPRTPRGARWLIGLTAAYALSPVDLIPDFIPVIGHLDDLLIVPLGLWLARCLIPADVIAECRRQVDEEELEAVRRRNGVRTIPS